MKKNKKNKPSILIASIAVLISLFSLIISLRETQILKEQQAIMKSEKDASVWPYMENSYTISNSGNSSYSIVFTAVNKGIGPAIIDSVSYHFKSYEFNNWNFHKNLQELFPNVLITNGGNAELGNRVFSSGEKFIVFRISIENKYDKYSDSELNVLVNDIASNIHFNYCYCSVYDSCWKVEGDETLHSTRHVL